MYLKEMKMFIFCFWYDKSFNLFNSDSESVMKLKKISNQTMIDVNLKEKKYKSKIILFTVLIYVLLINLICIFR